MWQNTTEGNGSPDEGVQLFVTTDGELQVTRRDTLDLQVLGGILEISLASVLRLWYHVTWARYEWRHMGDGIGSNAGKKGVTHSCELKDFGSQILEHSRDVDCSLCTNTHLVLSVLLQESLNTTTGELKKHYSQYRMYKYDNCDIRRTSRNV